MLEGKAVRENWLVLIERSRVHSTFSEKTYTSHVHTKAASNVEQSGQFIQKEIYERSALRLRKDMLHVSNACATAQGMPGLFTWANGMPASSSVPSATDTSVAAVCCKSWQAKHTTNHTGEYQIYAHIAIQYTIIFDKLLALLVNTWQSM